MGLKMYNNVLNTLERNFGYIIGVLMGLWVP